MTAIELTGSDRVGLLSEVFAVLSDLKCDLVESKVWTHNKRISSLIYLKDCESGCPINNSHKIESIELD
ncbi:putative [Protein-PII] uridylyltransferase [Helianthus anomalus]